MPEVDKKPSTPAYGTYKSFLGTVRRFAEDGLPSHIDRSIFSKMSGSQQSAILGTYQFLKLVDANYEPTAALKKLVKAGADEYGQLLREIVENAYGFIFKHGLDLKTTTTKKVEEAFRDQGAAGSTGSKAIAFFLACCKDANIEVSKFVRTPAIVTTPRVKRNNATGKIEDEDDEYEVVDLNTAAQFPDLHPAIAGMLRDLPPPGQPWPKSERDRFLNAFTAILSFAYPEGDS